MLFARDHLPGSAAASGLPRLQLTPVEVSPKAMWAQRFSQAMPSLSRFMLLFSSYSPRPSG